MYKKKVLKKQLHIECKYKCTLNAILKPLDIR